MNDLIKKYTLINEDEELEERSVGKFASIASKDKLRRILAARREKRDKKTAMILHKAAIKQGRFGDAKRIANTNNLNVST